MKISDQKIEKLNLGQEKLSAEETKWLASFIDHTLLKVDATEESILKLCQEAKENSFFAVCVREKFVSLAVDQLSGSSVKVACVVGFPSGLEATDEKVRETKSAIALGAAEIDMVVRLDWLRERRLPSFGDDIRAVVKAAQGQPVKVILETSEISNDEILIAGGIAMAAGATFLKTSTGFAKGGATEESVKILKSIVGQNGFVKASGGVRDLPTALKMILCGASRIGTSSGVAILRGENSQKSAY